MVRQAHDERSSPAPRGRAPRAGVAGAVLAPCLLAAALAPGAAAAVEPYQRHPAQYRLVDHGQYRLIDAGQYRRSRGPGAGAARYHALIASAARASGLQPELLHAVITVESAYDPRARSHKGAQGLMQLMPETAARYTVSDPFDPAQNLQAGARHLRYLIALFGDDLRLALAAYNAGEEAVRRHANTIPPYAETREYVRRVLAQYQQRLTARR